MWITLWITCGNLLISVDNFVDNHVDKWITPKQNTYHSQTYACNLRQMNKLPERGTGK